MKFASNIPIYLQIIDWVKEQIITETFPPGYQLPSRRQLAAEWKVNPNTVQKALKEMEESGMIQTQAQKPSTITQNSELIHQLKLERVDQSIQSLVDVMVPMGINLETVMNRIQERYQAVKEESIHD